MTSDHVEINIVSYQAQISIISSDNEEIHNSISSCGDMEIKIISSGGDKHHSIWLR